MQQRSTPDGLSDQEAEILGFERSWWTHGGGKEIAIRDRLDLTPSEYYRLLSELIDRPAALETDPLLVRRLRRQRLTRRRERSLRRSPQ